ncbi:hypothetical protein EW146_g4801 [Bondarzewia mesenterica]|uniref:Uncharacterized protein n=1 Tax=Bondarzewia mesenterica TaxID=1095465 RepID=A0A4S4LTG1_9AGAM|nr:hypothetical protein EW146_g4801 [Bondarzewia mesenterica]
MREFASIFVAHHHGQCFGAHDIQQSEGGGHDTADGYDTDTESDINEPHAAGEPTSAYALHLPSETDAPRLQIPINNDAGESMDGPTPPTIFNPFTGVRCSAGLHVPTENDKQQCIHDYNEPAASVSPSLGDNDEHKVELQLQVGASNLEEEQLIREEFPCTSSSGRANSPEDKAVSPFIKSFCLTFSSTCLIQGAFSLPSAKNHPLNEGDDIHHETAHSILSVTSDDRSSDLEEIFTSPLSVVKDSMTDWGALIGAYGNQHQLPSFPFPTNNQLILHESNRAFEVDTIAPGEVGMHEARIHTDPITCPWSINANFSTVNNYFGVISYAVPPGADSSVLMQDHGNRFLGEEAQISHPNTLAHPARSQLASHWQQSEAGQHFGLIDSFHATSSTTANPEWDADMVMNEVAIEGNTPSGLGSSEGNMHEPNIPNLEPSKRGDEGGYRDISNVSTSSAERKDSTDVTMKSTVSVSAESRRHEDNRTHPIGRDSLCLNGAKLKRSTLGDYGDEWNDKDTELMNQSRKKYGDFAVQVSESVGGDIPGFHFSTGRRPRIFIPVTKDNLVTLDHKMDLDKVRKHTLKLMGRDDPDAPFTGIIATDDEQEVKDFDPKNGPCCIAQDFRLDLHGTPKSAWNVSATKVFAKDFIDLGTHSFKDLKEVENVFTSHLRSLRREFLKRKLDATEQEEKKREASRLERKRTLFHNHLEVARTVTALRPHVSMLQRLSVDAMSSDEPNTDHGHVQYAVYEKE